MAVLLRQLMRGRRAGGRSAIRFIVISVLPLLALVWFGVDGEVGIRRCTFGRARLRRVAPNTEVLDAVQPIVFRRPAELSIELFVRVGVNSVAPRQRIQRVREGQPVVIEVDRLSLWAIGIGAARRRRTKRWRRWGSEAGEVPTQLLQAGVRLVVEAILRTQRELPVPKRHHWGVLRANSTHCVLRGLDRVLLPGQGTGHVKRPERIFRSDRTGVFVYDISRVSQAVTTREMNKIILGIPRTFESKSCQAERSVYEICVSDTYEISGIVLYSSKVSNLTRINLTWFRAHYDRMLILKTQV